MDPQDIKLESVNWEHGMLLTPEHFLRQERYFDSALLWSMRYLADGFGLIGSGPRLPESERGAVKHDPVVSVDEDDETLNVTVSQCRGLTSGGVAVEITPERPVRKSFKKAALEGVAEAHVYVLTDPQEKRAADGAADEANPQMKTARVPACGLALQLHAEDAPYALTVARLKRAATGMGFEKDAAYVPPCAYLVAHSELVAGWRRIVEEAERLFNRYSALYRAMQEYLGLFRERGIETELDVETMHFVGRMTTSLQETLYELLDQLQPADQFFMRLRRFFHSAAVYLDLSPPVRQYYDQLIETGETEYVSLLEQQKRLLSIRRRWEVRDDLGLEIREALGRLHALSSLELALEGKYVDFRISPAIEAMNFIFDRGGRSLFKIAAKHSRLQGFEDELTIHFAQLRLEGRDRYRLILAAEDNAVFETGEKITAEIRLNEGSGFRREPIILSAEVRSSEHRNFEFDFEAPDVPTITDLKVSIPSQCPIRSALLFKRHRFYAADRAAAPAAAPPPAPAAAPPPPPEAAPGRSRLERSQRVAPSRFGESRVSPSPAPPGGGQFEEAPRAPWESPGSPQDEPQEPPRRRRRLE